MEKYRLKEAEAVGLSDFLSPMLEYYPERRATAQQMLNHYWLNMPANFDCLMSEREYERNLMMKRNQKKENAEEDTEGDVIESDSELNVADDEDNDEYESSEEDDDICQDEADIINIQNFNNSFAAYGQHVNLAALDRANPQFTRK
jgi:hypothetical protein